jgi:plasmid stabilization system protein ParE
MKKPRIIWSRQALDSVRDIYLFYKEKSPQSAKKLKQDLLQSPRKVYFSKQYQVDDINSAYRRIVVRNYKILYTVKGHTIHIIDVFDARQAPGKLGNR